TVWSPKGQFREFRGTLRGDKEPFKPSSVDLDAAGNILVVDQGNHHVQVWRREFELLCAFGTLGYQQPDHLWDPNFVTVAPNGDVIVSVCAANRCLVF
ncbi:NHL repeat-containing protein, partial [Acanthamoeba castellanii str. Neff]